MIKVVDKEMIRRLHKVQGWLEKRIAREFGFARTTVRKYLREDGPVESGRRGAIHVRDKNEPDKRYGR